MPRQRTATEEKLIAMVRNLKAENRHLAEYAADVEADRDERPTIEQVNELRTKLATDRAKTEFQKLATGKIRPDALDDAWNLLGHKVNPDAEAPDVDSLTKGVESLVSSRSYLAPEPAKPVKLEPGEGASRGGNDKDVGGFVVTEADARNPEFMALNQSKIAEHSKAGTLRWA